VYAYIGEVDENLVSVKQQHISNDGNDVFLDEQSDCMGLNSERPSSGSEFPWTRCRQGQGSVLPPPGARLLRQCRGIFGDHEEDAGLAVQFHALLWYWSTRAMKPRDLVAITAVGQNLARSNSLLTNRTSPERRQKGSASMLQIATRLGGQVATGFAILP
jgi:hypothetical protein